MKSNNIGYTAGVYDMFHVGHLNLLKQAKEHCDYLIVGVNSDELTYRYKGKYPVIPLPERMEIVKAIKYVDEVVCAEDVVRVTENGSMNVYEEFHPKFIVIGDDHKSDPRWKDVDEYLRDRDSEVVYIPYTASVSSTQLKGRHSDKVEG